MQNVGHKATSTADEPSLKLPPAPTQPLNHGSTRMSAGSLRLDARPDEASEYPSTLPTPETSDPKKEYLEDMYVEWQTVSPSREEDEDQRIDDELEYDDVLDNLVSSDDDSDGNDENADKEEREEDVRGEMLDEASVTKEDSRKNGSLQDDSDDRTGWKSRIHAPRRSHQQAGKWKVDSGKITGNTMSKVEPKGFGDLPVNVLHWILSLTLCDSPFPEAFHYWTQGEHQDLAEAMMQRIKLAQIRHVNQHWRDAVDSHYFWPHFTLLLDPARGHASTVTDLEAASLTPSTPSHPTLFHRARNNTLEICLACRLNHPDRLGRYPAAGHRITRTSYLGWAPTCQLHHHAYCSCCMREMVISMFYSKDGSPRRRVDNDLGICPTDRYDVDEHGKARGNRMICQDCRFASLRNAIEMVLLTSPEPLLSTTTKGQSRHKEGTFHASRYKFSRGDLERNMVFSQYLEYSTGILSNIVQSGLQEQWLQDQTRWDELSHTAYDLQIMERKNERRYVRTRGKETREEMAKRWALIAEFEGIDDLDEERVRQDQNEQERLYCLLDGKRMRGDYEGLDISVEGDKDVEDECLSRTWWLRLRDASINDWIKDRISFGFWISPNDEHLGYTKPDHLLIDKKRLAAGATLPVTNPGQLRDSFTAIDAATEDVGKILQVPLYGPDGGIRDTFLPPTPLLRSLQTVYRKKMRKILTPALEECVKYALIIEPDSMKAEKLCEGWTNDTLLSLLKREEAWHIDGFAPMVQKQHSNNNATQKSSDNTKKRKAAEDDNDRHTTSPRIEVVTETDGSGDNQWGIQEVHSPPTESTPFRSIDEVVAQQQVWLKQSNDTQKAPAGHNSTQKTTENMRSVVVRVGTESPDPSLQAQSTVSGSDGDSHTALLTPPEDDRIEDTESAVNAHLSTLSQEELKAVLEASGGTITVDLRSEDTSPKNAIQKITTFPTVVADKGDISKVDPDSSTGAIKASSSSSSSSFSSADSGMSIPGPPVSEEQDDRMELESSINGASRKQAHTAESARPWIPPLPAQALGQDTNMLLREIWWDVRAVLRECHCTVCERAKRMRGRDRDEELALGVGNWWKKQRLS